jgi:DeoR family fructose operon transcriptional repressor
MQSTNGIAAVRREKTADLLRERRVVMVAELCDLLGVSPATVRRDLADMEQQGKLRRVHGGAVAPERRLEEPVFDDKAAIAPREKAAIARAALPYVGARDSIFLDGGSTVLAFAALLRDKPRITVVTNSLRVAGTLSGHGPRVIVVGGELRRLSQTFVGCLTPLLLNQLHFDTAFMGTIGISGTKGLTTTDPREAETKSLVMQQADRVILLADSSKVGKLSFVKFGAADDLDVLVTDKGAAKRDIKALRKKGIEVITG